MKSALTRSGLVLALGFWSTGCAGHAAKTLEARNALDAGRPSDALALYNEELDVKTGKDLPDEPTGDTALLILDRSMILQQLEDFQYSSRDLELADKEVLMMDFSRRAVDDIGKYLFSDDVGPYQAPPYEKLLINTMNMVNYLARHDLTGARVEARRLAITQKYLRENEDPAVAMLAPGSYLAGFTFERSGNAEEALRYYDEALAYGEFPSLVRPIRRLQQLSPYNTPRITKLLAGETTVGAAEKPDPKEAPAPPAEGSVPAADAAAAAVPIEMGELLVVIQYGRVPAKVAKRVPIGLALTFGALYLSNGTSAQANELAAQGLVTWVNYPDLEETVRTLGVPSAKIDGHYVQLESALAVDNEARRAYERDKGKIIAAAITRLVARTVAGIAAGEGVKAATNDGLAGLLTSLATQAVLTGADTPDTRSWATLPARITLTRLELPPGKHTVEVAAQGSGKTVTVDMKPGGWAAVSLTVLR